MISRPPVLPSDTPLAQVGEADAGSVWRHIFSRNSFLLSREAAITLIGVLIFTVFSIRAPYFLTVDNLFETARFTSFVAIVAVGWTYLLIAAELDLSVGPMYSFCQIMCAWFIVRLGVNPWVAFFLAVLVGAGIGAVSGAFTTVFGVPSFIVTLGMLSILLGGALVVTGSFPITVPTSVESNFFTFANGTLGPVPSQVVWMFVVCIVGGLVLRVTPFGSRVYATGGNERAARQAGIKTGRIKFACFVLTGALVGLVGALSVGWLRTTSPVGNQIFTLQVIASVIVGGAALYGGAGSIYGTLIGALILGMLSTGLILMGISSDYTFVVTGLIIVIVGTLDVLLRRGQSGLRIFWRRFRFRSSAAGARDDAIVKEASGKPF
jgi:ribose/xylose/arabinose/galactoside ABC-type transport system permease subunit